MRNLKIVLSDLKKDYAEILTSNADNTKEIEKFADISNTRAILKENLTEQDIEMFKQFIPNSERLSREHCAEELAKELQGCLMDIVDAVVYDLETMECGEHNVFTTNVIIRIEEV